MTCPRLNDSVNLLSHLATRRSARPRDLVAPGPDAAQLRAIADLALRTPDHGKLAPWRAVHIAPDQREAFAAVITAAYRAERPAAGQLEIDALLAFARQAPCLLAVLATPRPSSKIPVWEQHLSAGAFCMNLLHAAHAYGFVGGWVTGWAAYSPAVVAALGGAGGDQIAAFIFIGTPGQPLAERPRPDVAAVIVEWTVPPVD